MGSAIKFNWVLQIDPPAPLQMHNSYPFEKTGNRMFPVNTPIDLIDIDRNAIAKIKITSFSNTLDRTSGSFEVIKLYIGTEQAVLSNYWAENR